MIKVVVTGANKGIGFATAKDLLEAGCFVFLGARDVARGEAAVQSLAQYAGRVQHLRLDVTDDASVTAAAHEVSTHCKADGVPLTGLINNAGAGWFGDDKGEAFCTSVDRILGVNYFGLKRVTEAFLPLLDPVKGRIVNVSSALGPSFVSKCSPERQRLFVDPTVTQEQIAAAVDEFVALSKSENPVEAYQAAGLGPGDSHSVYSFSKACVNMYTMLLARTHPALRVNACTPGFIETDLTRPLAAQNGRSPADMGMKDPAESTKAALHLLLGDLRGSSNGWFYGSDAQRSPLDRYRSPGDPPYDGK